MLSLPLTSNPTRQRVTCQFELWDFRGLWLTSKLSNRKMSNLSRKFVEAAFDAQRVWDLGNDVLYKLCVDNPWHTDNAVIIAKTLIIGRVYAAALERRRAKRELKGDEFYVEVAKSFRNSDIDFWLRNLRCEPGNSRLEAIKIHKKLTDLLHGITDLQKRSFASKYLHFHFPKRFFIFDTKAEKRARQLTKPHRNRIKKESGSKEGVDKQYSDFCARCELISEEIGNLIGEVPTPRQVDKVLLHLSLKNS